MEIKKFWNWLAKNKKKIQFYSIENALRMSLSGGELLEMQLLDSHLLDTFGRKSSARHKIDKLLESS